MLASAIRWHFVLFGALAAVACPVGATDAESATNALSPSVWAQGKAETSNIVNAWKVDASRAHETGLQLNGQWQAEANQRVASRSVMPTGWRRTTRGWERAEAWAGQIGSNRPQTINEWILSDRAKEPKWVNASFQRVRAVHPVCFGILIVLTAVMITKWSEPGTETASSG